MKLGAWQFCPHSYQYHRAFCILLSKQDALTFEEEVDDPLPVRIGVKSKHIIAAF